MTEYRITESFPFDSSKPTSYDDYGRPVLDRAVGALIMREVFGKFFSNGVFPNPADAFRISKGSGLSVSINPGICIINGAMGGWRNDPMTFALDAASGKVAHGIFLRYDGNSDKRSLYVRIAAGEAGTNPVPPDPETGVEIEEIRLGYIVVPSGATDLSGATVVNEKGLAVCPYAAPFLELDLSKIVADAQLQAGVSLSNFLAYLAECMDFVKSALDETTAGHLQNQIDALAGNALTKENLSDEHFTYTSEDPTAKPTLKIRQDLLEGLKPKTGAFTNAASGWNTFSFSVPFNDIPTVVAMPNGTGYTVEVKDVAASQFLYRLLKSGSATADAVEVMWIAAERGDVMGRINAIVDTGYDTLAEVLADESAVASLAMHEDAMTILYDDATARGVLTTTPEYMNTILGTSESYTALNDHPVMIGSVQESDMAVAKYMSKLAGIAYEEVNSCSELTASLSGMQAVAASSAAVNVLVGSDHAISASAASNSALKTLMGGSVSKNAIVGTDSVFAKFVAVAAGLSISAYATFAAIAANSSAIKKVAASERALYLVCKNSAARTTWMNGSYAHTYYDTVYSTLHGASDDLFAKYEDYYSNYLSSSNTIRIAYTNSTGGVSAATTGDHGSMFTLDYSNVATFDGVTLLSGCYTGYMGSQCLGSSQSKKDVFKTNNTQYTEYDTSYVFVGGMTFGDMYYLQVSYATYAAK